MRSKSQQAELEVDWFLKDSREGNLEPALFAAFLYDHTVIFSGIAELRSSISILVQMNGHDLATLYPSSKMRQSSSPTFFIMGFATLADLVPSLVAHSEP